MLRSSLNPLSRNNVQRLFPLYHNYCVPDISITLIFLLSRNWSKLLDNPRVDASDFAIVLISSLFDFFILEYLQVEHLFAVIVSQLQS